jgi:multidrug efflux pump subunit AcrB
MMLPGPLGSLFGDMAIALVISVIAGWLYAQFCLPSLYRLFFDSPATEVKKQKAAYEKMIFFPLIKNILNKFYSVLSDNSLEKNYACFLNSIFNNQKKVFAVAAFSCVIGICTLLMKPVIFINPDEAEEINISIVFPPGTLLETTGITGSDISRLISGLSSVKTVFGKAGAEEEDVISRADIDYIKEELVLRCILEKGVKPDKALSEIKTAMLSYEQSGEFSISAYFPKDRTEVLLGLSTENTFVIRGKDIDELHERTKIAEDAFKPNSVPVNFKPSGKRPELRLYINREASAYLSIPAAQIAETLYVLNEGVVASKLEIDGRLLDVRVTGQNSNLGNPVHQLEQYPLKTSQGKTVYLGSLSEIKQMEADASLARLDRSDAIYISFLPDKKNLTSAKIFSSRFPWFT